MSGEPEADPRLMTDLCGCIDVCRGSALIAEACGEVRRRVRAARSQETPPRWSPIDPATLERLFPPQETR